MRKVYEEKIMGISLFTESKVEIIGEDIINHEGKEIEVYVYNIVGYIAENGKPFTALKNNIVLL